MLLLSLLFDVTVVLFTAAVVAVVVLVAVFVAAIAAAAVVVVVVVVVQHIQNHYVQSAFNELLWKQQHLSLASCITFAKGCAKSSWTAAYTRL
jgi:hypothetical protein